jgi:hypothetical protein
MTRNAINNHELVDGVFMTANCQVYFLRDPRTGDVFYVGIGKPGRANAHVPMTRRLLRTHKKIVGRHLTIANLFQVGLLPQVEIVHENLTKDDAKQLEIGYIARLGRKDIGTGILDNRTSGGEWINDCPRNQEWLERMSVAGKIAQNRPETKALKSTALKNKKRTADQIENIRQGQLSIRESVSEKRMGSNNPAAKKCVFMGKEYGSIRDASLDTGIAYHTVARQVRMSPTALPPTHL